MSAIDGRPVSKQAINSIMHSDPRVHAVVTEIATREGATKIGVIRSALRAYCEAHFPDLVEMAAENPQRENQRLRAEVDRLRAALNGRTPQALGSATDSRKASGEAGPL